MRTSSWLLGGFVLLQLLVLPISNGVLGDEGIYILAGMHALEGLDGGFSGWINGSLYVWPVLSAMAYGVGDIGAVRILAITLTSLGLACIVGTLRCLCPRDVSLAALLLLLLCGPLWHAAHLGVYDAPAFAFFCGALFFAVRCQTERQMSEGIACGLLAGLAVVAKYGYVVMAPALVLLVLEPGVTRSWRRVLMHAGYVAVSMVSVVLLHNLLVLDAWWPKSYRYYETLALPDRTWVLLQALVYAPPFALAGYGFKACLVKLEPSKRRLMFLLLLGALVWPVFHIASSNLTSAYKHIVVSYVFLAPLLGFAFVHVSKGMRWATMVGLVLWSSAVWAAHEFAWESVDGVGGYVASHMQPGERVASTVSSYRFAMRLHEKGEAAPVIRVEDRDLGKLRDCQVGWLVTLAHQVSDARVRSELERCLYRKMFVQEGTVFGLRNGQLGLYPYVASVWKRHTLATARAVVD